MQDSGTLEDADTVKPEDVKSRDTWRSIASARKERGAGATWGFRPERCRRIEEPGQPGARSPGALEGARSGETRRSTNRRAEGARIRGNPETYLRQQPDGAGLGET